jgi:oxygen-independent coproporphyrinogen III oxidase
VRDPERVHFRYRDMLWEGSDLVALGVASFGHLSGVHYQNATHWDDYLAAVEAGRLPIARGLVPTTAGAADAGTRARAQAGRARHRSGSARKFGVDPLAEWAEQWQSLESEGYLERTASGPVLTRRGLLQVDSLLPRFFAG